MERLAPSAACLRSGEDPVLRRSAERIVVSTSPAISYGLGQLPITYQKLEDGSRKADEEFVAWIGYRRGEHESAKYFAATVNLLTLNEVTVEDASAVYVEIQFTGDANKINSLLRFVRRCEKHRYTYDVLLTRVPKKVFSDSHTLVLKQCTLKSVESVRNVRKWKLTVRKAAVQ